VSGKSEEFLDEIEAVLIQVVEPPLNSQGPRWKKSKVIQFDQADDPQLDHSDLPSIATKQSEMESKIDEVLVNMKSLVGMKKKKG